MIFDYCYAMVKGIWKLVGCGEKKKREKNNSEMRNIECSPMRKNVNSHQTSPIPTMPLI